MASHDQLALTCDSAEASAGTGNAEHSRLMSLPLENQAPDLPLDFTSCILFGKKALSDGISSA